MNNRIIFFNNLSNVMKLGSYLAVSFFMTPFLVHTLGVTHYGIWAIVLSVVGYMTLMDLGMQSAVMKYVAEYDGKKDKEALSEVIISSLVFYGIVALVGGFILIIFVWIGLPLLKINPAHFNVVRWILLIMGIDMLLVFPGTVFQGVLTGMQLFYITNSVSIILIFFKAGAIYLAISNGNGLVAMALITLLGNLIEYCIFFILVRWRYHIVLFRARNININKFKQMISFGLKSFLVMISGRITLNSDSLIVGYFMSASWVPFYTIPASLINYSRNLLWALTQSFLPLFSNLQAKDDLNQMQIIYLRYTRYTCLCFYPLLLFLIIYGEPFIRIWIGPQFAENGKNVVILLSVALWVGAIQPLSGRLLTATSRLGIQVWASFLSAGIFLGTGVLLIKKDGLTGLATAFLIGTFILTVIVLNYSFSIIRVSMRTYFKDAIAPPLLTSILMGAFLFLMKNIHYPVGYASLIFQSGIGIILYALLTFPISLTKEERAYISGMLVTLGRSCIPAHWKY